MQHALLVQQGRLPVLLDQPLLDSVYPAVLGTMLHLLVLLGVQHVVLVRTALQLVPPRLVHAYHARQAPTWHLQGVHQLLRACSALLAPTIQQLVLVL